MLMTLASPAESSSSVTLPTDSLNGHWKFDDESGQLVTATVGDDGTLGNNTSGNTNDPTWNGKKLEFASDRVIWYTPEVPLSVLDSDLTAVIVVKAEDRGVFWGFADNLSNLDFHYLFIDETVPEVRALCRSTASVSADASVGITLNNWYAFLYQFDSSANEVGVEILGGASATDTNASLAPSSGSPRMSVGNLPRTADDNYNVEFECAYLLFYEKLLSTGEKTDIKAYLDNEMSPRGITLSTS